MKKLLYKSRVQSNQTSKKKKKNKSKIYILQPSQRKRTPTTVTTSKLSVSTMVNPPQPRQMPKSPRLSTSTSSGPSAVPNLLGSPRPSPPQLQHQPSSASTSSTTSTATTGGLYRQLRLALPNIIFITILLVKHQLWKY